MKRGDIYFVSFDPTLGHEQRGARPVFVVSADAFNRTSKLALVVPITSGGAYEKNAGFAVLLPEGLRTTGVVLCNRARSLDLAARGARFVESVPAAIVGEVLARLRTLLE